MKKITISSGHPDAGRVYAEAYDAALVREAALREELEVANNACSILNDLANTIGTEKNSLQRRLTVAEKLLGDWYAANANGEIMVDDGVYKIVTETAEVLDKSALKPAAEGEGS